MATASRSRAPAGAKQRPRVPLAALTAMDALRTWGIPGALVGGGFPRVFEAAAYTDVRVGRISADDFLDALAGPHARDVGEIISFVTERWITLALRLARFLALDLRARVAASLIEVARGFGVEDARGHVLSLRITQDALADLSAGSLRKVNAVLRQFEHAGLIGKDNGRIVLHHVRALEELATLN